MSKEKHAGGRPLLFKTEEELEIKIDEYFESCIPEYLKDKDGELVTGAKGYILVNMNAPSLSKLALYLGYASRQSLYDNEKKEEFSYIIKKARSRVEDWLYQHSLSAQIPPAVGIFLLKQFGYTDKQELEHSGAITNKHIDMSKLSIKELEDLERMAIKAERPDND